MGDGTFICILDIIVQEEAKNDMKREEREVWKQA
jgi:hypothetical protein